MLMRSIHDFIALTKNNNIDLRTKSEVDIVILDQYDKIMIRPENNMLQLLYYFQPSLLNHRFLKGLIIPIKSLKQTFN